MEEGYGVEGFGLFGLLAFPLLSLLLLLFLYLVFFCVVGIGHGNRMDGRLSEVSQGMGVSA